VWPLQIIIFGIYPILTFKRDTRTEPDENYYYIYPIPLQHVRFQRTHNHPNFPIGIRAHPAFRTING
jgi:hypothetical protein